MSEFSIRVENLRKNFKIYHEKRNSFFEGLVGMFNRRPYYEILEVLKQVTFDVKKGEIFGIVGPNGAGKTTLLRIISGIYKSDGGKTIIEGSLVPLLGLGVGFEVDLDARANIIRYGILLGFSKKEISSRIDQVIKYAELEQFADTKLKNFSSGMYQRLAFATAYQVNPDILLLDESIFVGDLGFQEKCFNTMRSFKNEGKSIIFVSHNMSVVKDFCDRAMFLNDGVAKIIDQPDKVIKYYQDFFSSENKP